MGHFKQHSASFQQWLSFRVVSRGSVAKYHGRVAFHLKVGLVCFNLGLHCYLTSDHKQQVLSDIGDETLNVCSIKITIIELLIIL